MSLLGDVQAANLEWSRKIYHVDQGEEGEIWLLKRDVSTNQLTQFKRVKCSWSPADRQPNGDRLPMQVQFELRIAEELIEQADVNQAAGIQHGSQIYQIVTVGQSEPGIFKPFGADRFWRFWIASLEEI